MKRFTKIAAATMVSALAFAMPVMANPSLPLSATSTAELEKMIDGHAVSTMIAAGSAMSTQVNPADAARHIDMVVDQVVKLEQSAANNHFDYLQKVINNAKENVRIKQEIVTNYTNLAKVNPQFEAMIPAAQADLLKAQLEVLDAEKALADAKAEFAKYFE